jgi:uncharacterized membrane protein YqjE
MDRLPLLFSELTGTAGRLGGMTMQILRERMELMDLELRAAKIRFVQELLLVCAGVVFTLLGLLLLVLAGVSALKPEWRLYGLAAAAAGSLLAGLAVFMALRRRLASNPSVFAQSLAELKKDTACFWTKN